MPSLVIDYTVNKIIQNIQSDFREKGKEISYGAIVTALEAQLHAIVDGMADGNTVVCKYLGTFKATKKRIDVLNKQYERKGKKPTLVDKGLVRMSLKGGRFVKEIEVGTLRGDVGYGSGEQKI